ncbi:cytochrome b [Paraphotobacterium marinum]
MYKDTKYKLTLVTVFFHWFIGLFILFMLALGVYMTEFKDYSFYSLHKSIGAILLIFVILRIYWRFRNKFFEPITNQSVLLTRCAHSIQFLLITMTLVMPVSGIAMSYFSGNGLKVFDVEILARNIDDFGKKLPIDGSLASLFHEVHHYGGYIFIALILIHIFAAIRHIYRKENFVQRILGKNIEIK